MDKKSRIINSILLSIIGICFFPIAIYVLVFIYSKLNIEIFTGSTFKSNLGDIMIYFILPITLVVIGIYQYFLNRYNKLIALENESNNESNNDSLHKSNNGDK